MPKYFHILILDCLSPCKTCFMNSVGCTSCIDNLFLDESTNTCRTCHPLCSYCTGVLSTQCISCKRSSTIALSPPSTCYCVKGYYFDSESNQCEHCHPLCDSCYGPFSNQCYEIGRAHV